MSSIKMNVYVFLFMPVKKLAQLIFCLQLTLVVCGEFHSAALFYHPALHSKIQYNACIEFVIIIFVHASSLYYVQRT